MGASAPNCLALVVEGGALRSIFSAGVLDALAAAPLKSFDFAIGVSGGVGNLLFYLSDQPGIAKQLIIEAAQAPQFIQAKRFVTGGHLIDLDWFYDEFLPGRANIEGTFPLQCPLWVCTTHVSSGLASYHLAAPDNINTLSKASMALPWFYRKQPCIDGQPMVDGGISDGIPVAEAIRRGATIIVVIRSRPTDYVKTDTPWHKLMRWKLRKNAALVQTMRRRIQQHEEVKTLIENPPSGVTIVDICPPANFRMGRFGRAPHQLLEGYQCGIRAAERAIEKHTFLLDTEQLASPLNRK